MRQSRQCNEHLLDNSRCTNEPLGNTDYCGLHGDWFRADLEVFSEISEHFRQDVREFWYRSNFFLLVQGVLVSVFVGMVREGVSLGALPLIVGLFGLVLSLFWIIVAKGSVDWISKWRRVTILTNNRIDRHASYEEAEGGAQSKWSPQQVTSYLPIVFVVGWVLLLAWELSVLFG